MSFFNNQNQTGRPGGFLKSREEVKNEQANMANIGFQNNIMALQAPLERMLGQDGKFAPGALGALGRGFPTQNELYDAYRRELPPDRAVNMEAISNLANAAKQAYDTRLGQNIAFQRTRGRSEADITKDIASENPDLLSYAYQNELLQPKVEGVLDDFLVGIGAGGAAFGGTKLFQMSGDVKTPSKKTIKALKKNGYDWDSKKGRIFKMSKSQVSAYAANRAGNIDFEAQKDGSLKKVQAKTNKTKIALEKKILKNQNNLSGAGKQAIKQGGSKRVRNIATNMALKNVGKHFGAKAAVGIAARSAGGLLSWPVALTIGAAQLAPVVYRQFKNEE